MPVQTDAIIVTGTINCHSIYEKQTPFYINSTENKLSLDFKVRQESGLVATYICVQGGLKPGNAIHILKAECELYLQDNEPDFSPQSHLGLYFSHQPVQLCLLNLSSFRGEKSFVAKLTLLWSESKLVFQNLAPSLYSPPSNAKPLYIMECGEDNTVHEREDKELQITEEVDFSSARIGERPSNFPLVSKLTTVKGIRRVFALVMPDQEPYYFAINIVRDRQEYNRGWVQLRAASPGERRGTQLSRLAIDMSIGEVASAQIHCVPETEYEGGVFLLPMQIDIPKGERYLVSCTLKMEFPVEATIYELNVGDVPVCIAETISLNSEKQHPLPNLSEVDDEDSQEDLHIDDAHFSRSTWSKFLGFLRELFRLHRDRKDEVAWWPVVYDMEASHNLMTLRVQKDIGSKLKPAQPTVLFVSGIKIQVLGSTTAGWRRMGRKRRYKGKFYVVDTAEFDVTVGKEFIQKNGLPEPLGSVGAE